MRIPDEVSGFKSEGSGFEGPGSRVQIWILSPVCQPYLTSDAPPRSHAEIAAENENTSGTGIEAFGVEAFDEASGEAPAVGFVNEEAFTMESRRASARRHCPRRLAWVWVWVWVWVRARVRVRARVEGEGEGEDEGEGEG